MKYSEKLKRTLPIILLPIVSYGLLGPLEIFSGNQKDFSFQYSDFFWYFLIISIVSCLAVSALIALLPEKVRGPVSALILGVGMASYIQNMFMNIKLSEADGSPMRWEELGNFPVINSIIWLAIFVGVFCIYFFLKKYWNMISVGISGFLSAIQLVAVISLVISLASSGNKNAPLQMSGEDQLKVAPDSNIVVFVLDTVGNTALEETLELYPDAIDGLKDFTFYNNTDCHYYCTFPSMTHMMTGQEFDFEMQSQDWLDEAWASERATNFWGELDDEGYSCYLYSPDIGYVYGEASNLNGKFDNIKQMETDVNNKKLLYLLGKMSAYKYAPYILKPYLEVLTVDFGTVVGYVDGVAVVDGNGEYYQELTENGLSIDNEMENALIIQHLFGAHKPYTIDENANIVEEEATREQTIKGLLVIVDEYIRQLQELGLYDEATIIVTADHGAWYDGDTQPIFFIKRSNETHDEVRVNTAPISLDDFQATILEILGRDYSAYGTSISDWDEGSTRERTVYMRQVDDNYPDVEGSSFNVYYKYSYLTNKEELNKKVSEGPEEILPATPW